MQPTADFYKQFLLKVYRPKVDFTLFLTGRVTTRILGTYCHLKREIRINNGNRDVEVCSITAIHELAHHIHFTEQGGINEKPHGKEFKPTLRIRSCFCNELMRYVGLSKLIIYVQIVVIQIIGLIRKCYCVIWVKRIFRSLLTMATQKGIYPDSFLKDYSESISQRTKSVNSMSSQFIRYIQNEQHYNQVLSLASGVKQTLWIGTADIKDLYVKRGADAVPFLALLAELIKRGVAVRLIHAKEPGPAFRDDFDRYPALAHGLERVLCPRVHFKMLIFDMQTVYIGSANLTGAALGMKSPNRRNFEAGLLTNEPTLVDAAAHQFDTVWMGTHCAQCGRKQFCTDRIK